VATFSQARTADGGVGRYRGASAACHGEQARGRRFEDGHYATVRLWDDGTMAEPGSATKPREVEKEGRFPRL